MAKKFDLAQTAMRIGGLGAGAIGARALGKLPFVSNLNPMIQGVIKIAVGAGVPIFMGGKDTKPSIINHIGDGIAAVGAMELAGNFIPAIAGMTEENNEVYGIGLFDDENYQVQVDDQSVDGFDDVINGVSDDVAN